MELVQNSGDEGLIPRIAQTTPRIRGNSNAYMFIIAANTSRAERHQPDGNGYDLLILEDLRAVANAVGRTPRRGESTRSEERRVGKECGGPCRSRWAPEH